VEKNFEQVVAAQPKLWIVSLSGFNQNIYERGHQKGDIEAVKQNMRKLSELNAQYGNNIEISVSYHCYSDNMGEEYAAMKRFSEEIGIMCIPTIAFFYPLEKLFAYFDGTLTEDDQLLIDRLIVSPEQASKIALKTPSSDCNLRSTMMAINCDGSVSLCCTVFDKKYQIAEKFLDVSLEELQARKYSHETCKSCMGQGLHDSFSYTPVKEWRAQAQKNLSPGFELPEGLLE